MQSFKVQSSKVSKFQSFKVSKFQSSKVSKCQRAKEPKKFHNLKYSAPIIINYQLSIINYPKVTTSTIYNIQNTIYRTQYTIYNIQNTIYKIPTKIRWARPCGSGCPLQSFVFLRKKTKGFPLPSLAQTLFHNTIFLKFIIIFHNTIQIA